MSFTHRPSLIKSSEYKVTSINRGLCEWRLQIAVLTCQPANPKILHENEKMCWLLSHQTHSLTHIIISYELSYCQLGEKSIRTAIYKKLADTRAQALLAPCSPKHCNSSNFGDRKISWVRPYRFGAGYFCWSCPLTVLITYDRETARMIYLQQTMFATF